MRSGVKIPQLETPTSLRRSAASVTSERTSRHSKKRYPDRILDVETLDIGDETGYYLMWILGELPCKFEGNKSAGRHQANLRIQGDSGTGHQPPGIFCAGTSGH